MLRGWVKKDFAQRWSTKVTWYLGRAVIGHRDQPHDLQNKMAGLVTGKPALAGEELLKVFHGKITYLYSNIVLSTRFSGRALNTIEDSRSFKRKLDKLIHVIPSTNNGRCTHAVLAYAMPTIVYYHAVIL